MVECKHGKMLYGNKCLNCEREKESGSRAVRPHRSGGGTPRREEGLVSALSQVLDANYGDLNKAEVEALNLLRVTCLVLPTGKVLWFESDNSYAASVVEKWKEENPEFNKAPYTLGLVEVIMKKTDYIAIGAKVGPGCFEFPE